MLKRNLLTFSRGGALVLSSLLFFFISSCRPTDDIRDKKEDNKELSIDKIVCLFETSLPEDVTDLKVTNEKLQVTNVTTGEKQNFSTRDDITLLGGLYNIDYSLEGTYLLKGKKMQGRLVAQLGNFEIKKPEKGEKLVIVLPLKIVPFVEDFVIEELFFTGTLTPIGKQYRGDQYFILYNGTDHTLYADGIAFCESSFNSAQLQEYKPDIRSNTFTTQAIYVIPGNGKEHPVAPGERVIVCDQGLNHITNNKNSFDLSKATFEWYDESPNPKFKDIDTPVPNLDKWYCYTKSIWNLHDRGFLSYVIARIPQGITKEIYLKEYFYEYKYVYTFNGQSFDMNGKGCKVPNKWIIDGVNVSVQAIHQWNILPEDIDAGWTNCGTTDHQKNRYFHSVRRKYLGKDANGNKILQDTNNSTDDFNPMVTPSLIEEQGTAIDAKGTPCNKKTYDGVVLVK